MREFVTELQQLVTDVEARHWLSLPLAFSGWHRFVASALHQPRDKLDESLVQIEQALGRLKDGPVQSTNSTFGLAVLASMLPSSEYLVLFI